MRRLVVICLGVAWVGCCFSQPAASTDTPSKKESGVAMRQPSDKAIEQLALKVASDHLSIPPADLQVVKIEAVEWPDSSIGCPDPGFEYVQVVTPGYLAYVRDPNAVTHRVHIANGRGLVCENHDDKSTMKADRLPTFTQPQLEALARADLATRLAVPTGKVSVLRSQGVEWPDATLGCANAEGDSASGPSKGFVITLVHQGREYEYHSDLRRVVPCPPIERR